MSNKLQELTDKLYNEGLSKGKEEGELLLAKAHKEADDIVAKAKADAEAIVAEAGRSAADLRAKAESDVKMASAQSLQATRKSIEDLLVGNLISDKVKEAAEDPEYLKKIISAVCGRFSTEQSCDLRLILPEALQQQLEPWVKSELRKALDKGVEAEFSKKVSGGFSIGPKDGSWYVSLSEETFRELIAEYIRPVTRKLLFGDNNE
jgi:V/A-type H+/Na+-transporting ATPase subunit E